MRRPSLSRRTLKWRTLVLPRFLSRDVDWHPWGRPHTCMHTLTHVLPDTVYWNAIMRPSDAKRGQSSRGWRRYSFFSHGVCAPRVHLTRLVVDLEEEKTEGVTSPSIADPIKDMIEKNKQRKERKAASGRASASPQRKSNVNFVANATRNVKNVNLRHESGICPTA